MTGSPQGSPSSPPPDAPGDSAAQNANAAPAPAADNALPADSAGESADEHEAALKNPDGSWKYTNDLIKESSPYLLQHAHNPVQWHAWGKEAFELARKTGKPIFLSIGYSTCYWCHVMERQCFENPEIAKQMNEQFVCIKVDREERPDVDDIYMAATQALTGGGGWPMSVFLTPPGAKGPTDPGLKPFFAGTFFPAVPQNGMPAFGQLMTHLTNIWTNERNRALEASDALSAHVQQLLSRVERGGRLDAGMVRQAANQLMRSYDPEDGGFGRGRNKFPTPNNLLFLIRVHQNNPDDDLWEALSYTLERMARGGIYDHVGGGFHRYATDTRWLVPHFEKMLYDNGQLVEAYLVAQSVKPDAKDPTLYQRVARQTCQYVLREMTDPTGTFWSAQDAEVDAREGGNYIWTPDEVRAALADRELATLALKMYGLDRGTNFQDPHHPQAPAANVIHLPLRLDELAADQGVTLAELLKKQQQINQQLYAVRMKRKQPRTDDKVLVSWNGLMIGGLAMAGRQLNEPRFTQAAARAAGYILDHMRTPDGGLYRAMRNGKPRIDAFLDDYAFFVHGLIELHRADHDQRWLDAAEALTAAAAKRFAHPDGGYYDTLAEQADLFVRTRGTYDGAIPTGNSQMVHDLLDLHALTNNAAYLDRAILDLQSFAAALDSQGATMAHMQHALLRALEAAPAKVAAAAQPQPQPAPAGADQPQPLTVAVDPPRLDLSTGSATLKVSVTIAPGYHINATDPGDKLLIPTKLSLEEAKGLELTVDYPKGQSKKYAFADQPLNVYEGAIVLQVTIRKASDDAANARPVLVLRYQACTDKACLKPKDLEVPVVFEGLK